jgi:hypothetical protein
MEKFINPFDAIPVKSKGRPKKEKKNKGPEEAFRELKKALENDPEMKLKINREGIEAAERRNINKDTTKDVDEIVKKMRDREKEKHHMKPRYYGHISSRRSGPIWGYKFEDGIDYHFPMGATLLYKLEEGENYFIKGIHDLAIDIEQPKL